MLYDIRARWRKNLRNVLKIFRQRIIISHFVHFPGDYADGQDKKSPDRCPGRVLLFGSFGGVDQFGEGAAVVDGEVGEHFAVDLYAGYFQAVHQLAV